MIFSGNLCRAENLWSRSCPLFTGFTVFKSLCRIIMFLLILLIEQLPKVFRFFKTFSKLPGFCRHFGVTVFDTFSKIWVYVKKKKCLLKFLENFNFLVPGKMVYLLNVATAYLEWAEFFCFLLFIATKPVVAMITF